MIKIEVDKISDKFIKFDETLIRIESIDYINIYEFMEPNCDRKEIISMIINGKRIEFSYELGSYDVNTAYKNLYDILLNK